MSESDKDKKPEFLAAIKLVSGEEILSMVTHVQDVNGDYLIVENPIQVEEVTLPNKIVGAKVQPWMKFSREEEFIIPKDKVITISEIEGDIVDFYNQTLQRLDSGKALAGRGKKLPRESGYVGSVKEMKKTLEGIFKRS